MDMGVLEKPFVRSEKNELVDTGSGYEDTICWIPVKWSGKGIGFRCDLMGHRQRRCVQFT